MATLSVNRTMMPAVKLGDENPLPIFRAADPNMEFPADETVPEDFMKYIGWQTGYRVLPYRMQDSYSRELKPREMTVITIENEHIRASFLPELGGRMSSLVDLATGYELLEPVINFQPVNIALRDAWLAGGVEWNAGQLGHHYLTCSPINAARILDEAGDESLRLYAWDRVKGLAYQIDVALPDDSRHLFVHVRLVNTQDSEVSAYWWSNIGVKQAPDRRILVSADRNLHHTGGILGLMELPVLHGRDITYTTNLDYSNEFYFDIPKTARPWVACVDGAGRGLVQTSTSRLCGRKLFAWGTRSGGQRWQQHLLGEGREYLEIQAGLARTQLEHVPMPARAEWSWTEAYGLLQAEPERLHSSTWSDARQAVQSQLEKQLPQADMELVHAELERRMLLQPAEVICHDEGWASLERIREQSSGEEPRIPTSLVFAPECREDQQPWLTLLHEGTLPCRDIEDGPGCYMIQYEWHELLERSAAKGASDHWLGWLHLGVMRHEANDLLGARDAWVLSVHRTPSSWAYRNLAVLEQRAGHNQAAYEYMQSAWQTGPRLPNLAVEFAGIMEACGKWDELKQFLSNLPAEYSTHERIMLAVGKLALHFNELDGVEQILQHNFANIREGEVTLTDLWFALQAKRISDEQGVPLDDALRARVRRELTPPSRLDYRMAKERA